MARIYNLNATDVKKKKVTHKIQYNGVCEDNIERRYYESPQASYTRR